MNSLFYVISSMWPVIIPARARYGVRNWGECRGHFSITFFPFLKLSLPCFPLLTSSWCLKREKFGVTLFCKPHISGDKFVIRVIFFVPSKWLYLNWWQRWNSRNLEVIAHARKTSTCKKCTRTLRRPPGRGSCSERKRKDQNGKTYEAQFSSLWREKESKLEREREQGYEYVELGNASISLSDRERNEAWRRRRRVSKKRTYFCFYSVDALESSHRDPSVGTDCGKNI